MRSFKRAANADPKFLLDMHDPSAGAKKVILQSSPAGAERIPVLQNTLISDPKRSAGPRFTWLQLLISGAPQKLLQT